MLTANARGFFSIIDFSESNPEEAKKTYVKLHETTVNKIHYKPEFNGFFSCDRNGYIKFSLLYNNEIKEKGNAYAGTMEPVRDLSSSQHRLVSAHEDKTLRIWNLTTFKEESKIDAHGSDVTSVDWHPTKTLAASGGKDRLVKVWDLHSNRSICSLFNHTNTINSVAFSKTRDLFVSAGKDQIVRVFDIRTFTELYSLNGHAAEIYSVQWNPATPYSIVSADVSGKICLWSLPNCLPVDVQTHSANFYVPRCAFDNKGEHVLSSSYDKSLKLWKVLKKE